ncbi:N-acetyltransferase [Bacillus sp. 31A1R]|uniref:N-acetyltransferase n=1 Tax=Robertmurraya mangrovi TaxID=3098077 RepID=A0ABU5J0X0_9BACI|nr:N-acetyltransferase [Bacillus sp. 31A1R]MDZ5473070.1 N-acetyltransferase [Bacillus sp. 31A1R]
MTIHIRQEKTEDYSIVEEVIKSAFADMEISDKTEHELVARIRKSEAFIPELSLVATNEEENIIGHILFSKIHIVNDTHSEESLALAPVSVLPDFQNIGVGKLLINEGLKIAKELGYKSVVVLGHPNYYPKFGFEKASSWGINPPFKVPDEVFMIMELRENALEGVSGVVEYSSAFSG